jgi:hypothetical protein
MSGAHGLVERLTIHVRNHQDFAADVVLGDYRNYTAALFEIDFRRRFHNFLPWNFCRS